MTRLIFFLLVFSFLTYFSSYAFPSEGEGDFYELSDFTTKSEGDLEKLDEKDFVDQDAVFFEKKSLGDIPSHDFDEDPEIVWKALLHIMAPYQLEVLNKFYGYLKTRWLDHTFILSELEPDFNFESFKMRYFIILKPLKTKDNSIKRSRVTIYIQQHYLEKFSEKEDWRGLISDNTFENTVFYRIQRLINLNKEFKTN